jgi:TonB family protein
MGFVFRTLVLFLSLSTVTANACDCERTSKQDHEVSFHGTILEIKLDRIGSNVHKDYEKDSVFWVKILIINSLQSGLKLDTVTLVNRRGNCGIDFRIAESYYIQSYLLRVDNQLDSNILFSDACTKTHLLNPQKVQKIPDTQAEYIDGGQAGMMKFLMKNIKMPRQIESDCRVLVQFLVDSTGAVVQPVVTNSCGTDFDAESVRMVKLLKFKPATQNGVPIKVVMILPFLFKAE